MTDPVKAAYKKHVELHPDDHQDWSNAELAFHKGYHARDAEIERLKAGIQEIADIAVKYQYAGIFAICDRLLKGGG